MSNHFTNFFIANMSKNFLSLKLQVCSFKLIHNSKLRISYIKFKISNSDFEEITPNSKLQTLNLLNEALPGEIRIFFSRKEVFQPHLPVRLPCYDLAPVTGFTLGRSLRLRTSGTPNFHGLTGGVYKARERIHRAMADARLLANPASRSRVADSDPN